MSYRTSSPASSTATLRMVSFLTQSNKSASAVVVRLLREGADPWSTTNNGVSVLELCLNYNRRAVLDAWEEAAGNLSPEGNPAAALTPILWLVATRGRLAPADRQHYLRRFLAKGADPGEGELGQKLMRSLLTGIWETEGAPAGQAWGIIAKCLERRPELGKTTIPRPGGFDESLWKLFVSHAPMGILTDYISGRNQRLDLDWRTNRPLISRIHRIADSRWIEEWRVAGMVFKGTDDRGDTILHHYLRSPWTTSRSVQSAQNIMRLGDLNLEMVNQQGESIASLVLEATWEPDPELDQFYSHAQQAKTEVERRGNWKEVILEAPEPEKAREVFLRRKP